MRGWIARTGAGLLILALAGCGARYNGHPTVHESTAEASANAPLVPYSGARTPSAASSAASSAVTSAKPRPSRSKRKGHASKRLSRAAALAPATEAPPPPPANVDPCQARNLTIRVVHEPPADPGSAIALVVVTNSGRRTCALSGWPNVTLTHDGAGVTVPTTTINEPRSPVGMVLHRKRSAFAALRWTTCAGTAAGCRTFTGARIGAPGADPVQADLLGFPSMPLRASALQVGSIQPTTTNIISW